MAWTKEQRYTIESRNESLLVSAAAGSGKTSVLVERVTGLLKEGADLNRMLIVTFTNAAAAEMKERIAKQLGNAAVRHSHISTFHKFAMDIIRRYYYVTGVNPSLAICDEYKQSILQNNAMDEMFEELFEKDDPDFIDFLNCYATVKSSNPAKELIFAFFNFIQSFPNPKEYLESVRTGDAFNIKAFMAYTKELAANSLAKAKAFNSQAISILESPAAEGADPMPLLAEKLKIDAGGFETIEEQLSKGNFDDALKLISEFSFQRLVATKAEKPSYAFVSDEVKAIREMAKDAFKEIKNLSSVTEAVLEKEREALKKPLSELAYLTEEFSLRYGKKKLAEGLMDFSDVEHFALEILENKDVCSELKSSFDYIFVDEYQDSNLIQDDLIFRIAREDNVFLVGDVKQSIYKFRLAEPELFLDKYNRFKRGENPKAKAVDLNSNFRSKGPVIDFINREFEFAMRPDTVGIEYDEAAALKEGNPYTGALTYKPELYLLSSSDDGQGIDPEIMELKEAELEAVYAAEIIKKYHGKMIWDAKAEKERPLEYSDMVILLRSVKNRGELFYQALENADIPVFLERGEGYFDVPEIQVLMNLLSIIDNFRNDVELISVLHFPSFGFDAASLAAIRIYSSSRKYRMSFSDSFRLYAEEGTDPALKKRAEDFLAQIEMWRKKAQYMPLDEFIWELLSESGIADFAAALPLGVQRSANLRALADKALAYEQQSGGGLYGFISYIKIISDRHSKVDTGQVSVLGEGADSVRIMTIHKSKGLEFPFVLLAGLGSQFNNDKATSGLAMHKDFGTAVNIVEPKKGLFTETEGAKLIKKKKKQEQMAENIRVLYVAMTRAKDILVMSAAVKDAEKLLKADTEILKQTVAESSAFLPMVIPALDKKDIHLVSRKELSLDKSSSPSEYILSSLDKGFDVDISALPLSEDEIKRRLGFDYAPKEELLLKTKYSVSELAQLSRDKKRESADEEAFELRPHRIPKFLGKEEIDAAARGTAYHSVMEHLPFDERCKDPAFVSGFIEELLAKNILTEAEASAVEADRIAAFFTSDVGQRALASSELHKEAPFVFITDYEGRRISVQGTIDCYFKEGDDYVLVDYKSNYIKESELEKEKERLKDEYIPQLKLYREALMNITGVNVKEGILYLFGINDIIKVC